MKLNLGCSDRHMTGYVNVDICPPCDQMVDLRGEWPWRDSSVRDIQALDVVEHLPDRVHTMNEAWRVLAPGGMLTIEVPSAMSAGAFQDPTHVSYWTLNSFQYFEDGSFAHKRLAKSYGIKARFKILSLSEQEVQDAHEPVVKIKAILGAVK